MKPPPENPENECVDGLLGLLVGNATGVAYEFHCNEATLFQIEQI